MPIPTSTKKALLTGTVGGIGGCALIGVLILLSGSFGKVQAQVLGTSLVVGVASVLGLGSAVAWDTRRWFPIGPLAAASVALAALATLALIWEILPGSEAAAKAVASIDIAGGTASHIALLALARLKKGHEWAKPLTAAAAAGLGTLIVATIYSSRNSAPPWQLLGILAIASAAGSISVAILHHLARLGNVENREQLQTAARTVAITCPRCAQQQVVPLGASRCTRCKLGITIEIDEEHCPKCGYVVFGLRDAKCPECGAILASEPSAA